MTEQVIMYRSVCDGCGKKGEMGRTEPLAEWFVTQVLDWLPGEEIDLSKSGFIYCPSCYTSSQKNGANHYTLKHTTPTI